MRDPKKIGPTHDGPKKKFPPGAPAQKIFFGHRDLALFFSFASPRLNSLGELRQSASNIY